MALRGAGLAVIVATMATAGCGTSLGSSLGASQGTSVLGASAIAEPAQDVELGAAARVVLEEQWSFLIATADSNHDGAISRAEYAAGHSPRLVQLFFAQFDANGDGVVTASEYQAALAAGQVEQIYALLGVQAMDAAIKPFLADGRFDPSELHTYLASDLHVTSDWPLITSLMKKLDLNHDGLVWTGPGEARAFQLEFLRPQLEATLGLPAVLPS